MNLGTYGLANLTSQNTATGGVQNNTIFRIGGLTKLFTTLVAFALRDAGSINIDMPLVSLLPGFRIANPFKSGNITLRQLLGDISGMPRYDYLLFFFGFLIIIFANYLFQEMPHLVVSPMHAHGTHLRY